MQILIKIKNGVIRMLIYELWEQFYKTGSVADYLNYSRQKGFYDYQGNRTLSETLRGTEQIH